MELKAGDIIHFRSYSPNRYMNWYLSIQRVLDRGESNHVAVYLGNDEVLEMDFRIRKRKIKGLLQNPNIAIQRPKDYVNATKFKQIAENYFKEHQNDLYDFAQLGLAIVQTGMEYIVSKITKKDCVIPFIDVSSFGICTEVVVEVHNANDVMLSYQSAPSPGDLLRQTGTLDIIKNFDEVM